MRQRMEEHRANPACASCHKMMDPIGFAMENFDGIGKWRLTESGQKVDAGGVLVDGTKIASVTDLRQALVRYSPQFVRTLTEKLMTYGLGRGVESADMPVVRSIMHDAEKNQYRFSSLIRGIVKSEPFQMNRKPATSERAASDPSEPSEPRRSRSGCQSEKNSRIYPLTRCGPSRGILHYLLLLRYSHARRQSWIGGPPASLIRRPDASRRSRKAKAGTPAYE
jgi:hypothetical protein